MVLQGEDQYTVSIISCSFLLRMRSISDKSCRKSRNEHFMVNNVFLIKSCLLSDTVEKCCRSGQATGDMTHAHCTLKT